jgi:kynurenine formamidase
MRPFALSLTVALSLSAGALEAQTPPVWKMPADADRCPSKWGAGDQRGSGNWMKPETVLRATRLIRTGQVFELAEVLSMDPAETFLNRGRVMNVYTKPSMPRPNARTENEELVVTELGQVGTQLDAFAHQMWGDSFYNCFKFGDIASRNGYRKLGVENVGMLMTRGVLADVAGLKGVDMLPDSYQITPQDLQQALAKESLTLQPGDAVIIHTGWGKLMGKENERYERRPPGLGSAAGQWLASQDPMLIAADNCCIDARPGEPGLMMPIHGMMLIQYGIHLIENLKLDALVQARAYEFAFVVQSIPLKGATGMSVAPVAIR